MLNQVQIKMNGCGSPDFGASQNRTISNLGHFRENLLLLLKRSNMGPEGGYSNLARIAKFIDPPSGESCCTLEVIAHPQSPMLPLHHSGHRCRGNFRLIDFGLLAYPCRTEDESISLYSLAIQRRENGLDAI